MTAILAALVLAACIVALVIHATRVVIRSPADKLPEPMTPTHSRETEARTSAATGKGRG